MNGFYKFLMDRGQLVALLLGVLLVAIVTIQIISGLGSAGYDTSTDLVPILKSTPGMDISFFNGAIGIPTFLLGVIIAALVIFTVVNFIKFPKAMMRALIVFGALLLLFGIFYGASVHETTGSVFEKIQKFDVSENASKLISSGIKGTGILIALSVLAVIVGEVYNLFK